MKRIDVKMLVITSIVCLLPIILGLAVYEQLPEMVAIHFDLNNNPDSYFPKEAFVFGMPIGMMLIQILMCVRSDIIDKYKEANKKAITMFKWVIPIIVVILYIITLSYALGNMIDIRKTIMVMLGIMFIVMGNYIPKTKGVNYLNVGKVKDEELYNKLKKVFGYMCIGNGVLAALSAMFTPTVSAIIVILIIIEAIIISVYAWKKCK